MIDYEKVRQGLKSCSGIDECQGRCPYDDGKDGFAECTGRLAKDAYQLLEQIRTKGGNEMDKNKMDHSRVDCSYNALAGILTSRLEKNPNNLMSTDGELKQWQRDILNDPVNHPSHYTDGKIEVIDFIEDKKLGFHLGNAIKYIARAGKKNPAKTVEDLQKAVWYIERYIEECKRSDGLKVAHTYVDENVGKEV